VADYREEWDLGQLGRGVTALEAMRIMQSRPNDIFPFEVRGRNGEMSIVNGHIYDLFNTTGPNDNWPRGTHDGTSDPVKVSDVTPTSFTFTTLKGHLRGENQVVIFETIERNATYLNDDGQVETSTHVFLVQRGTYISAWNRPLESLWAQIANAGAMLSWGLQAHNLRGALGTSDRYKNEFDMSFRDIVRGAYHLSTEKWDRYLPKSLFGPGPKPDGKKSSGKPAARVSDLHVCPMVTGTILHVGGPIAPPGCLNVLVGGKPAARITDKAICNGPEDVIVTAATGILIGGLPAARMSDMTAHGGKIVQGFPAVLIADAAGGGGDDEGDGETVMA
jgi:uncharacterized Zn-binding protein involved in type VI secretion